MKYKEEFLSLTIAATLCGFSVYVLFYVIFDVFFNHPSNNHIFKNSLLFGTSFGMLTAIISYFRLRNLK